MASMTRLSVAVTDEKVDAIGNRLSSLMNAANQYPDSIGPGMGEEDHISGILFTLDTLGIPCQVRRNGEEDRYTAVDIAGRTFYLTGGKEGVQQDG